MRPAHPIFEHLLQPMSAAELRVWLAHPPLYRVARFPLERPGFVRTRRHSRIDGAVRRLARFAHLYDPHTHCRWSDLTAARPHLERWSTAPPLPSRRKRRRSRLLLRAREAASWIETLEGDLILPALRWIPEARLQANLESAAVLACALTPRRFTLLYGNTMLDAMLDAHHPDWEMIASAYPSQRVLEHLSPEELGRWFGRAAQVLQSITQGSRYTGCTQGLLHTCRVLGLGRILQRWCPPPSRHHKPSRSWRTLPTPASFFAGVPCTLEQVYAAQPLPPGWDEVLYGMPAPSLPADLLRGLHQTAPDSLRSAL